MVPANRINALMKIFLARDKRIETQLVIGHNPSHSNTSEVYAPFKIFSILIRCLSNECTADRKNLNSNELMEKLTGKEESKELFEDDGPISGRMEVDYGDEESDEGKEMVDEEGELEIDMHRMQDEDDELEDLGKNTKVPFTFWGFKLNGNRRKRHRVETTKEALATWRLALLFSCLSSLSTTSTTQWRTPTSRLKWI